LEKGKGGLHWDGGLAAKGLLQDICRKKIGEDERSRISLMEEHKEWGHFKKKKKFRFRG